MLGLVSAPNRRDAEHVRKVQSGEWQWQATRNMKNYKLESLWPDRLYAGLHKPNIKTDALRNVAASFFDNMMRVDYLSLLPLGIACIAEKFGRGGGGAILYNCNQDEQILATNSWCFYEDRGNKELSKARILGAMHHVQSFPANKDPSLDAWLSSLLLGAWTAFETFAADLWVAVLNAHPHVLSNLDGEKKRIQEHADKLLAEAKKPTHPANGPEHERSQNEESSDDREEDEQTDERSQPSKQDEGKMIAIKAIRDATKGSFNLAGKMGDLLRRKQDFTSVPSIREAYSLAFCHKKPKKKLRGVRDAVETALAASAIDALAAVRHVIIHKAGKVDADYKKHYGKLPTSLRVQVGSQLPLDGEIVKNLTDPVFACSIKLFTAIDTWLDAQKK